VNTENNLYYYRARYYDQTIGRFVSEDPIRFNSRQFNFYAYAANSPVNLVDRFGTCPQLDSVTDYHLKCEKIPSPKDKCGCHCVYAPDMQGCIDTCTACFKKEMKPREACMCVCKKILGKPEKSCKSFCTGVQDDEPPK
jgi:RHS repeat-associated protein